MRRSGLALALGAALAVGTGCAKRAAGTQDTTPTAQGSVAERGPGGGRGGRGGRGGPREDMMLRGITLTADQQSRVDAIRQKYRSQREGLDPRNNPDDRQKMMDLMRQQSDEIRAVLTPDQQKVYDQNVAEMRQRMQERRGGPGGGR